MLITKETKIHAAAAFAKMRADAKKADNLQREKLLDLAKKLNISVVHIYSQEMPKGGLTIAFRKASPYVSGVMVEVSVATCSNQDSFSKKTGTLLALGKFMDGETIMLPLITGASGEGLNYDVKSAFAALYFAVN